MKLTAKLFLLLCVIGLFIACDDDGSPSENDSSSETDTSAEAVADEDESSDSLPQVDSPQDRGTANELDTLLRRIDIHGNFSTFIMGITITNSRDELSSDGQFTIFVPSDAAFRAMINTGDFENIFRQEQHDKLRDILFHHIIETPLSVADLESGKLTTMAGSEVEITVDDGEIFYGGTQVVDSDYRTANGVFHALDEVVIPTDL